MLFVYTRPYRTGGGKLCLTHGKTRSRAIREGNSAILTIFVRGYTWRKCCVCARHMTGVLCPMPQNCSKSALNISPTSKLVKPVADICTPSASGAAKLLRELRQRLGVTHEVLAGMLSVSPDTVFSWLNGRRSPRPCTRRAIWIIHSAFFKPENLSNLRSLLSFGRL